MIHTVKSNQLSIALTDKGEIVSIGFGGKQAVRDVCGHTILDDCVVKKVGAKKLPAGGMKFTKTLFNEKGKHTLTLVEQFTPTANSIRWEIEIQDGGNPWSTAIQTRLEYPVEAGVNFWTAWADPRHEVAGQMNRDQMISAGIVPDVNPGGDWADPLVPVPICNAEFWYGAPPYRYDKTGIPFCPNVVNDPPRYGADQVFCIPAATFIEPDNNLGLSLVLSPEDLLLDMGLTTTKEGKIAFSRLHHRLGGDKPVRLAMDLIAHEADWRPVLGWMTRRYSEFFDPPNPKAHQIAGTGAYSSHLTDFDTEKMKAMAFMVNWKASFDFPYMGMFLPPVESDDAQWNRYGEGMASTKSLREYARKMVEMGFHVLSYFNVTEFGADIRYEAPILEDHTPDSKSVTENANGKNQTVGDALEQLVDQDVDQVALIGVNKMVNVSASEVALLSDTDLWKDCNTFLYTKLASAILLTPEGEKAHNGFYGQTRPGLPYWTWGRAVVMDPGEPVYQEYLLEQAKRHIDMLPDASGFCIDRMDWLRLYNHDRDDGLSWFGDGAVRSLNYSWRDLMNKLGALVHGAGKVLYCNNHVKRIEQMRHIDGIFDEFTYSGLALNTSALLGVRKPVLGWTISEEDLKADPDAFFQKYLYLGVFPMCPFPGNDHSLLPSAWVDKQYLDYGPLMIQMRGKKWVLEPHVVRVPEGNAKANLFEIAQGYVVPVVYAGNAGTVKVSLRSRNLFNSDFDAQVLHPGTAEPTPVAVTRKTEGLTLDVPVKRGCGMVLLRRRCSRPGKSGSHTGKQNNNNDVEQSVALRRGKPRA